MYFIQEDLEEWIFQRMPWIDTLEEELVQRTEATRLATLMMAAARKPPQCLHSEITGKCQWDCSCGGERKVVVSHGVRTLGTHPQCLHHPRTVCPNCMEEK